MRSRSPSEKTTNKIIYKRPPLYPRQEQALFCPERFALVEASTKSGKTIGAIAWLLEQALLCPAPHSHHWWVAPVYRQAQIAMERLQTLFSHPHLLVVNRADMSVKLPNGSFIDFRSGVHHDALYGEDVHSAVIDEASRVPEEAWHAIRTTLTATRGPVRMIGNVTDRENWFWRLCRRAEAGELPDARYSRITWRDAVEAGIIDQQEIELARATLPQHVFIALYEAVAPDHIEGALWSYSVIDRYRVDRPPQLTRIVVGVDPAVTAGESSHETGIIVAGMGQDGDVYVLDDLSGRYTPVQWGQVVVDAVHNWRADAVVAEVNQGGDLVVTNLRSIDPYIPVRSVRATRGKTARAEPVAILYEQGRVHHTAVFTELEAQLCSYTPQSPISPDRLDALVWSIIYLTERISKPWAIAL